MKHNKKQFTIFSVFFATTLIGLCLTPVATILGRPVPANKPNPQLQVQNNNALGEDGGSLKINSEESYEFAIIGGGPAGIIVVGLLLDLGIPAEKICWIDEKFNVGDLSKYPNVPANAKTKMFLEVLNACKAFCQCPRTESMQKLMECDLDKTYPLETIIGPLQDLTICLRKSVISHLQRVTSLTFDQEQDMWLVGMGDRAISSRAVVLATGSYPRSLNYEGVQELPFDQAIDPLNLPNLVNDQDTVALVGSAHSAILILKSLSELSVPRIFNFYTHPIVYPVQMDGWVLNDNTGLMGITAEWAQNVLEKNPPAKIIRLVNTQETRDAWLPLCNKIIYAVGFDRSPLFSIPGIDYDAYDGTTGQIGRNFFGIGIAFPEIMIDPLGNIDKGVGLPDFMDYAQRVVPQWILHRDRRCMWEKFSELFTIHIL